MDSGTKTSTSEFLKDKDYEDYKDFFLRVTEYQDINVWKEFLEFCSSYCNWMEDFLDKLDEGGELDEYTDEIDEVITDFLDFWAIARCWLKEWLGLTVENGDDNEEEMEEGQVSIEDGDEERTMRGGNKQDRMVGMVELLGEREKPTGEQDVGADYSDDREKDLDQEATKDHEDKVNSMETENKPEVMKKVKDKNEDDANKNCEVRDDEDLVDEEEVREFVEEDVAEGELGNDGGTTQYLEEVVAFVMKTENELEERKGVRDKYEDEANNDCEEMLRIIRMSREAEDEGVAL